MPAEDLWKGITSVSNAGKKRGRGKTVNKRNIKNLNKGQVIGVGSTNIVWPGLNSPVIRGRELVQQQRLPADPDREARLRKLRDEMGSYRHLKLSPIDRGWSGSKMPGRSIGAPDPIGEETFDGFDTKVLELKQVFIMKGNLGRKRRLSCMVVTGNGNGLAGFGVGKSIERPAVLRKAKNRAGQKMIHVDLCNGHTLHHDTFSQFGKTKIFIKQMPEGSGLVCHRAIATICTVLGIKDLYAKVEGSTNLQHVVKAFFHALLKQKTHEQMAAEKGLHVVQFQSGHDNFPIVVASPPKCRKSQELGKAEVLDVNEYAMEGKVVLRRKKFPPFYTKTRGYELYEKKQEKLRNHHKIRMDMLSHYGEYRSFLTDKYPECKPQNWSKKRAEEGSEEAV